jgi:hypothetical protein
MFTYIAGYETLDGSDCHVCRTIVDASSLTMSIEACLSMSSVILPPPLEEVERMLLTPLILDNIASSLEVVSISTTRAELPFILKDTVRLGNEREGDSFTVSSGTIANPASDNTTNATITVKDDMFFLPSIHSL